MLFRLLLPFFILTGVALAACSSEGGCPVDERAAVPTLLSVVQDPETLQVTATMRDESDNEQWFTLERAYISTFNQAVVVGTSVEQPDRETTPVNEETGRVIEIVDRLVFEGEVLEPDIVHVYTVRALNCYDRSAASNAIELHALAPSEG